MAKVDVLVELKTETCPECQIVFAIPQDLMRRRREDGKIFYCPLGHRMVYEEPEIERLKRELGVAWDREQKLKGQLDGALERINNAKRRANAGVCPHCHRSFANVRRHIETKHSQKL